MLSSPDSIGELLEQVFPHGFGGAGGGILTGLVGRGIQASRSPKMHEREGSRLGLNYNYLLIDFDQINLPDSALGALLAGAQAQGFAGLNVTHPFKQYVIPLLDTLSHEARDIGAVNTIVFANQRTSGYNTDCWGFAESFRDFMEAVPIGTVVLFGAGGAGAAVAYALMELGVRNLAIVDPDAHRAKTLADGMLAHFPGRVRSDIDPADAIAISDGIVNATPIGMAKYPGIPFDPLLLSSRHWVAEIVYFPQETELLRTSRALGCRTLSGTGMAIYQAVRAFELFTGRAPDRRAMAEHFGAAA